jgi:PAS domain S-box-containing protein
VNSSDFMESESRFRGIFEAAGIGLATANLSGFLLSGNSSFQKMIGYTHPELSKMHFRDFTHPDDFVIHEQRFSDLVQGRTDEYSLDKRYYTKSGQLLWVHIVASILHRSTSDAYTIFLIENISDRKQSEEHAYRLIAEKAARSEAEANLKFLNSVLQHMPAGVAIFEAPSGNLLLTNRRLNDLSESIGQPIGATIKGHVQTLLGVMQSCAIKQAIGKGEIQEPKEMAFQSNEHKTAVRMAVAPVLDTEGKVIAAVSTAYDITASKFAEDALRTNEKLASVGRLAATIAHEINNPLESVTNLLYLLNSDPEMDAEAKRMIVLAQEELGRVVHIVRQTLGFYRESSIPVTVNLSRVVDDVLALYARKIESGKVKVAKRADVDGNVEAFPGEMRQVISNLIVNALDAFNKREGAKLAIRIRNATDRRPGSHPIDGVKVVISDNAGGIKPQNLKRIFDPVFSTKGEKGTGLGLWVSHGIVQKHSGTIRVRTSQCQGHQGTTFKIFIPTKSIGLALRRTDAA